MTPLTTVQQLKTQRELLCQQLQQNRRCLAQQLLTNEQTFPRSLTMRLLMQTKLTTKMSITDWSQAGWRLFRMISSSVYLLKLVKRNLLSHGNTRQRPQSINIR